MAGFKKLKFGGTRNVHRHTGKGASEQTLPSRNTVNSLTARNPAATNMNDYAKATPGPAASQDINEMAENPYD